MAEFKEFHSYAGVDIHAVFGNEIFGEIQMVSYKIDREKAPVYTMGSADPRTIARGKRLITGACVFVVFDRDALVEAMNKQADRNPHLSKEFTANINADGSLTSAGREAALNGGSVGLGGSAGTIGKETFTQQTAARLADQILPFDITLVGASEYGKTSKMVIQGVELMSEAGGMSIDDLVIEKQMSFIARAIVNWKEVT